MAKSNAAEALPMEPQKDEEEVVDMTHEAVEIGDEIPDMTDEAVLIEDDDATKKAKFEQAKAVLDARRNIDKIPDMTHEIEFDDPAEKEAHYKELDAQFEAGRDIRASREKSDREEISFQSAPEKDPEPKKKGFMSRLRGLFGGKK